MYQQKIFILSTNNQSKISPYTHTHTQMKPAAELVGYILDWMLITCLSRFASSLAPKLAGLIEDAGNDVINN